MVGTSNPSVLERFPWSHGALDKKTTRNYGHATVELAMKIGENIKNLSALAKKCWQASG